MSRSKRLRLTARSSIKTQFVRFENHSQPRDGVSVDIIGNDLRMLYSEEQGMVVNQTADLQERRKED